MEIHKEVIDGFTVRTERSDHRVQINVGIDENTEGVVGSFGQMLGDRGISEPTISMSSGGTMSLSYARRKIKVLELAIEIIADEHERYMKLYGKEK